MLRYVRKTVSALLLGKVYKQRQKHLEICMSLFVFPILKYGDILNEKCSEMVDLNLENVLLTAAQVVIGTKRRTSHDLDLFILSNRLDTNAPALGDT